MARLAKTAMSSPPMPRYPDETPEARQSRLIALAENLAERQLEEGTASAQVITHYLRLGTAREKVELEILEEQKKMVSAKTDMLVATKDISAKYEQAIEAMTRYVQPQHDVSDIQ